MSSDELPFTHDRPSRDPSVEVVLPLAHAEQSLTVALALTRAVLDAISVRPHVAARLAASDCSTITDLADLLVRQADGPFRIAHEICASLVRDAIDVPGPPRLPLSAAVVSAAASARMDRPIRLRDEDVRAALDPVLSVAAVTA